MLVSFDVNYRRKLWGPGVAAPVLKDIAKRSDLVFAGVEEANLVTGRTTGTGHDAARALAALGPRETVIKDGPRGCSALIDGSAHELPAIPVRVVDPVGAGDAFVAGYLAEHLAAEDSVTRLNTAIQVGGLAVSVPGDYENLSVPGRPDAGVRRRHRALASKRAHESR